jgi:hypothetical protein
MSFKSFIKSKTFKKGVACTLAAALSVSATTYSGSVRNRKTAVSAKPTYVSAGDVIDLSGMLVPLSLTGMTTSTSTTTTTFTTATTTTTETSTTTTTTTSLSTTDVVTSLTTSEVTQPVTEAQTEEIIETPVDAEEATEPEQIQETTEAPREYVVYKASTHYIHKNTCHWCNDECVEIDSTEGLEVRKCTECNPDMEIITPYEAPKPATTDTAIAVTDYEYIMLCNLVAGEYGADWVSTYDKGAVVATVIHRLWEGTRWTGGAPASIYNVIAAPYQYDGKYLSGSYSSRVTQSCKDAVTYALNNIHEYDYYCNPDGTSIYMINSFYGDGHYNWFRCS